MKNIISLVVALAFMVVSLKAQEYGTHFMQDVWQSNYTNPGFVPRQTFALSVSPFASVNTSGINGSLFTQQNGEWILDLNNALANIDGFRLKSDNSLDYNIGFRVKKLFISLGAATKFNAGFNIPNDAFTFALEGNGNHLGETLSIGPDVNALAYQELSLGLNYMVNRRFTVGTRIKRYVGIAYINTLNSQLDITTSDDIYQLDMDLDYQFQLATGAPAVEFPTNGTFNDITEVVQEPSSPGDFLNNGGWGIDLGAQINLKDNIRIAASILDIGAINWESAANEVNFNGSYTFEGVDINPFSSDDVAFPTDTLGSIINVTSSNASFSTSLPIRSYISGNIRLIGFDFGALLYNEFSNETYSSLALSVRKQFGDMVSIGVVYAMQDNLNNKIGVNLGLNLGPLQGFMAMDDISMLLNPDLQLQRFGLRVGIGLSLGEDKMKEVIRGEEGL